MTILVCLVAGLSSRFGGKPKQLEKVGPDNETLIEYFINQALNIDIKIIFITNIKTENKFKTLFGTNYNGIPTYYAVQKYNTDIRNRPWGTLDAICSSSNQILNLLLSMEMTYMGLILI